MLIIEFPDEKANESYLANFEKQMAYYKKKKVDLKKTQISDENTVNKQLKFLVDYNTKYKFDFPFSELLISHKGLEVPDREIFFFKERRNPKKVAVSVLPEKEGEEEAKSEEEDQNELQAKSEIMDEKMEAEEGEEGQENGEDDEGFEGKSNQKTLRTVTMTCWWFQTRKDPKSSSKEGNLSNASKSSISGNST